MYSFTISFTQTGCAQAQLTFNGNAVAVYGTVSPFLADFSVTTDGLTRWLQSSSQGLANDIHMDTLLYFASGLTSGSHNLTLTANPAGCGQYDAGTFMDIDRIIVFNASKADHGNNTVIGLPQPPKSEGIPLSLTDPKTGSQNGTDLA